MLKVRYSQSAPGAGILALRAGVTSATGSVKEVARDGIARTRCFSMCSVCLKHVDSIVPGILVVGVQAQTEEGSLVKIQ